MYDERRQRIRLYGSRVDPIGEASETVTPVSHFNMRAASHTAAGWQHRRGSRADKLVATLSGHTNAARLGISAQSVLILAVVIAEFVTEPVQRAVNEHVKQVIEWWQDAPGVTPIATSARTASVEITWA